MSLFLPPTFYFPDDPEQLKEQLRLQYTDTAERLNKREISVYSPVEIQNGQTWFGANPQKFRNAFRKVIDFGALPNATSKSVAHNITITDQFQFTKLYAVATKPPLSPSVLPIPFSSPTLINNISLELDSTNVIITTGIDRTAYTRCYVVLEYLKN